MMIIGVFAFDSVAFSVCWWIDTDREYKDSTRIRTLNSILSGGFSIPVDQPLSVLQVMVEEDLRKF